MDRERVERYWSIPKSSGSASTEWYQRAFIGWAPISLGVFWSLAVEEHFYLFWPAFIRFVPKNKLVVLSPGVGMLALLSRLAITAFHWSWSGTYYLTTSRLDSLVTGAVLAVLVRQRPNLLKHWLVPVSGSAFALLAAMAIWRRGLIFNDWPMRTVGYSLLAVAFAGLVWMAGNTNGKVSRILVNPLLRAFGKYSHCLYMLHMFVLTLCERWIAARFFPKLAGVLKHPFHYLFLP